MVSAKFAVMSKRNIFLQFEEVVVENIKISEQLQALIAPAILPRSFFSLQILQFLKTFRAQVPVNGPESLIKISGDHPEDYIIFLTLTAICSWGDRLVVEEFLFSQEHSLFCDDFRITRSIPFEGGN
uniref:Uncharacterized protein n=1 Tax=Oryza sativa subsp. japonica TaxID=39947 RepID=Q8LN82_ORYSJ|nr:unknown protein [Oryza sativa Japonica Group]